MPLSDRLELQYVTTYDAKGATAYNKGVAESTKRTQKFVSDSIVGLNQFTSQLRKTFEGDAPRALSTYSRALASVKAALPGAAPSTQTLSRLDQFAGRTEQTTKTVKNYVKSVDSATESQKDFSDGTRSFIKSISGIYAAFVLAPRVAAEFGEALRNAAAGEAVRDSFEMLADSVEVNGARLLEAMKRTSRGTITEIELMRNANRAFLAGGAEFAQAIPQLFEIARAAAVATGKDVTWVMDSLTRGIARASAKLIDNAEIYIRVGRRVDEYAAALGKTSDELDETQRRQAILQAVLDEGEGLIRDVGADLEIATDAFDRYTIAVDEAKQATLEFIIDAMGPETAGAMSAFAGLLTDISPALQTLALLKLAGFGAALATGMSAAASAGAVLAPILAGLTTGTLLWDNVIRRINPAFNTMGTNLDFLAKGLQFAARSLIDGRLEAEKWAVSQRGMVHWTIAAANAQEDSKDELEALLSEVRTGPVAYREYVAKVMELNSRLEEGELAIKLMTQAQFDFNQIMLSGHGSLDLQIAKLRTLIDKYRDYRIELLKSGRMQQTWLATLIQYSLILRQQGLETDRAAEKEAELAAELERTKEAREESIKALEKHLDALSKLIKERGELEVETNQKIEEEARRHGRRLVEITRDAARDRAEAFREYERDIVDAHRDRLRDIEDAERNFHLRIERINRQHRLRLEEIERNHRRRLIEIQERYTLTARQAARRRDALAILLARERRDQETREAERDREDQTRKENEGYKEQIRQAQEAYQEQLRKAVEAFEDRLRKIEEALADELRKIAEQLAERQQKEDEDHIERMRKLKQRYDDEFNLLQAELIRKKNEIIRHVNETQGWLNANPITIPVRQQKGGGYTPLRHGFAGMVEGPQTFRVEAGVREFVYASGDLKGARESIPTSPAVEQMAAMRHSVRGGIGVGLSGLSSSIMDRIGPQMTEQISQAVIDAFADAILASF